LTPVLAFRAARRGSPVATVTLVLYALGAVLCVQRAAFGLYKIAMYSQPFLFGTLVVALGGAGFARMRTRRRRILARAAGGILMVGLAVGNWPTLKLYVKMSGGRSIVAEIPDASGSRITSRIPKMLRKHPSQHVVLDSCNVVLIKLFTLYARGVHVYVPSQDA